ncbi:MAG TPA: aminotransferase class I/II-fold pyridoxal phosphate-dependent enzyme [Ktedonosporobacter sp.]|jgi:cystathionine gamma-synthase/methionine-gamma-lyase|nr:aminotransferase class I/II-fold pyridoxal phosphate-dependent enzyme [Ktedonosporobacter sp.]
MAQQQRRTAWDIETVLVHSGRSSHIESPSGTPTAPPIYASTTYLHENMQMLDTVFDGTTPEGQPAYVYARHGNPNTCALEDALTQAEGGVGTAVFGSGMAAIQAALLAAGLTGGAKIVASQDLYGPTIGLLRKVFVPIGVELALTDLCSPDAAAFIRAEQPDIIYVETLSNPLVKLVDLAMIGEVAQEVGAVTITDNTFATPYLARPIEHGFDLVIHSATKYISGHGDSTGGTVTSSKNTLLNQLKHYALMLGAVLSPFEAHLLLRGLRTLPLRMERHCANALQVARFLEQHPAVARVYYPGLPSHPHHVLASNLLKCEHYGGLLAFELKQQSREAAFRFIDSLQLCLPATTLGDVFSQVSYPATSSHRTLTAGERKSMGIADGCIRLSVGIEHVEDIINDLDQGLQRATELG